MSQRVRIKMCGMTRSEDIVRAVDLGIDALGFVFYSGSKRVITIEQAKNLIKTPPPFVTLVAVLVNPEVKFVKQLIKELPIHCLQFHGDESPEFCRQFGFPYIKAIPAISTRQIEQKLRDYAEASGILVDTPAAGNFGGTGQIFDWSILPAQSDKPIILAGGLNSVNVQQAVTSFRPYAVDVCSGIEASPGVKDPIKMANFVFALSVLGA